MARSFFRSERMQLCTLLLHMENAFDCIMQLGHYGLVQFNHVYDEDRMLNGRFAKKVQLCAELVAIAEYLHKKLPKYNIREVYYPDVDKENIMTERDLPRFEKELRQANTLVSSFSDNQLELLKHQYYLIEWRFGLQTAEIYLHPTQAKLANLSADVKVSDTGEQRPYVSYTIISILAEKYVSFELLLYRAFKINFLIERSVVPELVKEVIGTEVKDVRKYFVLIITVSEVMLEKVLKICHVYNARIFECPEESNIRKLKIIDLSEEIEDIEHIMNKGATERIAILNNIGTELYIWRINLRKAKKVYDLLNRLSIVNGLEHRKYFQAHCYVPAAEVDHVREIVEYNYDPENAATKFPPLVLKRAKRGKHAPPTYFKINKFTKGFQKLIDSYGVAEYREVNPAPYTIITFPFLFAIMFGDFGHGIIMTVFATGMIIKENYIEKEQRAEPSENEIIDILFAGRYIILLMGLFSTYIGLIYNDVLSKSFNIFGSSWGCRYNESTVGTLHGELIFNANSQDFYSGDPYPFGMDPMWDICGEDSITTFNSLKMKLAIILGISQMMFGLSLSAANCIYFKRTADLLLVIVPQFIFMICLFGYLVFLIFFKWITYGGHKSSPNHSACAPSVLITFIDMMLLKSSPHGPGCEEGMFPGERTLEYVLLIVAFAAVPVLLAGKPIYLARKQRKLHRDSVKSEADKESKGQNTVREMRSSLRYAIEFEGDRSISSVPRLETVEDAAEFDMTEIWIHSGIHTIETVLGSISHTASYLRLWALSLAHEQLADVLWHMVLSKGLNNTLPHYFACPVLIFVFLIWAVLTVAILVMMEGLSAFLHTLRLHWVEFQSKFFGGSGEKFIPFYFPPSTIRD